MLSKNHLLAFLTFSLLSALTLGASENQRLIILADMGNEPDEEQQMTHMIVCSNEFEIEGLIAVTGKYLRPESSDPYKRITHPELLTGIINAYEKVLPNLKLHADGWQDPDYLRSVVTSGQPGYGIADVGPGNSSPGSKLITKVLLEDDPRPVWIVVNAGSNTLAQALFDYRENHSKRKVDAFVSKIRVFENGAQDDAGAWICKNFPDIKWYRSNYQTYCYGGPNPNWAIAEGDTENPLGPYTWEPYAYNFIGQHQWALEHINGDHGPLSATWPLRQFHNGRITFLEGGGTIPWLGLVAKGLWDMEHPEWGGWAGRFGREKVTNYWSRHKDIIESEKNNTPFSLYREEEDSWVNPENGDVYEDSIFVPVWRWRRAFYNNFVARMDWCVKPYEEANHYPLAVLNGDPSRTIVRMKAKPGQALRLDAKGSKDPDGDAIEFSWYPYPEAGTYEGPLSIDTPNASKIDYTIPSDASGKQIHIILEVKDLNPIASLFAYRRVVIDVE